MSKEISDLERWKRKEEFELYELMTPFSGGLGRGAGLATKIECLFNNTPHLKTSTYCGEESSASLVKGEYVLMVGGTLPQYTEPNGYHPQLLVVPDKSIWGLTPKGMKIFEEIISSNNPLIKRQIEEDKLRENFGE